MKVSENRIDRLNLELTIEIESGDYAETVRKKLAACKRNADFKGFRKGKVPDSMIKRVYGEQCLVESVNQVVSEALDKHIQDGGLRLLGEPIISERQQVNEWQDGNGFSFIFDLALAPEVDFEVGKSDTVPSYTVSATDEEKKNTAESMKKFYEGKEESKSDEEIEKEAAAFLDSRYKDEAEWRLLKDIREYFVGKAALELPEALLKRMLLQSGKGQYKEEDVEKEFPAFAADLKWSLVRSYLMQKFGLKIEDKDLYSAAEESVRYQYAMYGLNNLPEDVLREAVNQRLQDRQQLDRVLGQAEERKVMEKLKEEITIKPENIDSEAFRKL